MDKFWNDLMKHLYTYYDGFIALLPRLAVAILTLLVFYFIAVNLRKIAKNRLRKRTDDPLMADFVSRMTGYLPIIIGILIAFKAVGLGGAATSLLAGAGVTAFIIGFAFKDIGENFLAGMVMTFQRPYRMGDTVQVAGVEGKIIGMNLRDTQIKTLDGKDVFVPNGLILRQPIYNFTIDGFLRQQFKVGLNYDADLQKAMASILETLHSVPGVLGDERPPNVVLGQVTGSIVELNIYFWINTFDATVSGQQTQSDAINKVVDRLKQDGYVLR